jgi:uncharacterized membrane protein
MWSYRSRLERDLSRWRQEGWVSEAGAEAIRRDVAASGRGVALSTALAVLGAVLIGFAAMSFVAANWQDMSRLARLVLLLAGLWSCYGIAGALLVRGLGGFAEAAVLAGVGLFGASIMLIAQMYHIDGNPPDAVLTWAGGALLAGVVLRSNPALAAAMLLIVLWSGWQTVLIERVHWPFLLGWAAVSGALMWRRWVPGLHLSALVLSAWIISLGYVLQEGHSHWLVALTGLLVVGAVLAAEHVDGPWQRLARYLPTALCHGIVIAFAGFFGSTFVEQQPPGMLVLLAVLTLVLLLATVYWGWRTQQRTVLWLGYAGFSIEILALYFRTIGTLLGTSLFFLVAGVIVSALAWLAYRLHSQQTEAKGGVLS